MSAPESHPPQHYRQQDAQQILQLALARQSDGGDLSREQLFEMARELDVPLEQLQAAEREWLQWQAQAQQRAAFDRHRWGQLKRSAGTYAIVATFLMALDGIGNGALDWSYYIVLVWGLGVALKAWRTYQLSGEAYERAFRAWAGRRQIARSVHRLWDRMRQAL
ncbi:MAG: hypothetical protein BRC58_06665 [Cyanobacteria bacterium QS_8_64_29]|nr:MAG: hypothetical protein BRC58_06665 [Cyanobacteria bacterium QS_8_64_29]